MKSMKMKNKLREFEEFDIEKLTYHRLSLYRHTPGDKFEIFRLIGSIFLKLFIKRFSLLAQKCSKDNIFLTIYPCDVRPDIEKMLNVVVSTMDNKCDIYQIVQRIGLNFGDFFLRLSLFFSWLRILKKSYGFSFKENLVVISSLYNFLDLKSEFLQKIQFSKYRLMLSYYDAEPFQNYSIQYGKNEGCKTATLQHGIMLAPRSSLNDNVDFVGIEFKAFVSDLFLVWNDFTRNEAVKSGISEEKIIVLGISKCIGQQRINSEGRKLIGVILDGRFEQENNPIMIDIVKRFCTEFHYKYVVRYHPAFRGDEYSGIMDQNGYVSKKNELLLDFLQNIEFCVVANSTVLWEMEYHCIPFLNYSSGGDKDKYRDYKGILKFADYETMKEKYMRLSNLYVDYKEDTEDKYRKFFLKFLVENSKEDPR